MFASHLETLDSWPVFLCVSVSSVEMLKASSVKGCLIPLWSYSCAIKVRNKQTRIVTHLLFYFSDEVSVRFDWLLFYMNKYTNNGILKLSFNNNLDKLYKLLVPVYTNNMFKNSNRIIKKVYFILNSSDYAGCVPTI